MTGFEDLAYMDAIGQAELVRRKEIEPIELIKFTFERIDQLNPTLNAIVTPMYDHALRIVGGNIPEGPFSGVPYLLKDLIASYAGVPTTAASNLLKEHIPSYDSELVRRIKKAGLVVVGKTNTPEFGILPTTEPRMFGPCRNPWDLDRTPGGSSGGSAAAVAAGIVPMAHGNDAGGSIRIPSSCCGVFGLKPTRARNPLGPDFGDIMAGLVVEHAITRSVRDSAALLDATSGPDNGDPYWPPIHSRPFLEEVDTDPGRLRIGYTSRAAIDVPIDVENTNAVEDTVALCIELGHDVVEAPPQYDGELLAEAWTILYQAWLATTLGEIKKSRGTPIGPEEVEPFTWSMYEAGQKISAIEYLLALDAIQKIAREVGDFFRDFDVWLTPVLAKLPPKLGTFDPPPEDPISVHYVARAFTPICPISNVTGQPSMSVPVYWTAEGLPVGSHFVGRFGDEATLFRLAGQIENARPWAGRRPLEKG